jgi:Concanavalin A-like lectin/glucanases superfamily
MTALHLKAFSSRRPNCVAPSASNVHINTPPSEPQHVRSQLASAQPVAVESDAQPTRWSSLLDAYARSSGLWLQWLALLSLCALLASCSGGGAPTVENPITSGPSVQDYTGPPAANADVQAFRLALWDNIKATNRCGGCHNQGGQSPQFARTDDVNLAYQAANTVVNLTQPDQSRMVIKVGGGHNCWLAAASACADTLTVWIRNWAGAAATGGRQIVLQPPPIKDVGASKSFPTTSADFDSKLWTPILKPFCSRCHSSSAATPQSPFFASNDVDEAYAAAKSKINLDNPAASRFVVRLRDEFHNCWAASGGTTPDCPGSATAMLNAITDFADFDPIPVDPSLVISKALTLYDGTVAAGGNRYDNNVIALYEFKTGTGNIAYDTSGVEPALNLNMSGDISWVGGWGLNVKATGKAQGSTTASKKLSDLIKSTGEYTIEAWMANANVVQEDAYAVSYSAGATARNFTLAQRAYQYEVLARSSKTNANGGPSLLTRDTDRDAQASLQHVVVTYDPVNGRRVYVNGNPTDDADAAGGGTLADWDDTFAFVLGNETSNNRQWQGVLRLVAIHNRALTPAQIQQNFSVGVGERYFLLFSVSHLVSVPQSYLMLEATQLDSYGYQFSKPTFISLDPNAQVGTIPLKGVRIGVNGAEAKVGQAYIPLTATVNSSNYTAGSGQLLSTVGTVIALDKGPMADEFFLSFEQIGNNTHDVDETNPDPPIPPDDSTFTAQPDIGVRTFEEISASMSAITGVPTTNTAVAQTFNTIKQQLPTVESIDTFLASHQTAVAQLAIEYCNALVDDNTLRNNFFPGLNVGATASSYFNQQGNRDLVINPLMAKAVGTNVLTQPTESAIRRALEDTTVDPNTSIPYGLFPRLIAGTAGSSAGRTATVTKAACAAVLGSGAVLLQ